MQRAPGRPPRKLERVWPISAGTSSPVNKRGIARLPMLKPGDESPITNFYLTNVTLRSSRRQYTGKLRGKSPDKVIDCPFFSCVAQITRREVPPPWAEYSSR